ncbi:hypothetical protein AX761_19450 [Rhizobium sp. 58]|nr:hypothetical protein AX761_19450 [Rhizobium sp. 58]
MFVFRRHIEDATLSNTHSEDIGPLGNGIGEPWRKKRFAHTGRTDNAGDIALGNQTFDDIRARVGGIAFGRYSKCQTGFRGAARGFVVGLWLFAGFCAVSNSFVNVRFDVEQVE